MRIKTLSATILMVAIFISACNKHAISLSYTNAKGEVPQLENLVFRFNHSLVNDSMLNAWDSTEYITFEPRVPGRFRWEGPDQLVFSPAQPLSPATSYKATVTKEVLRYSKFDKVENGNSINFHTPALTLDNTQVLWMAPDDQSSAAVPRLDLYFNYRVDPKLLADKLKISLDEKPVNFTLLTQSPDNRISLRLDGPGKTEDRDYVTKITIDKGLKPVGGTNASDNDFTSSLTIPSPFVLTIQNVESEHDGSEGVVTVTTSQQLSSDALSSFLKFDPAVRYTTELTDNGFIIRSDKFDLEKSYALTIVQGLRGKIGGVLKEEYNGSIAFGELESSISFTNSKAVYLSKQGSKNIEVKLTNVPKVKIIISKIYENNLLLAQRYGYNPSESGTSETDDEEGDGGETSNSTDVTLGDVIYEKEIETRSLPASGGGRLLDFSQIQDRLPDFKGIYHVMIRSTKDYWVRDSRFISVSDLGLIAKQGEDKIFVFANSIKAATAVKGVNISLYSNNNQLIGNGATNEEGVAEISYAKRPFGGFRPAMLIARTGDDFNYLPFNNTGVNTSRFDVGGKRNNPTGLDAFIYAERDIYRPGEKLNYAVILRDHNWQLPGDIPLKFKFLLPNGKEMKTFRKTLNEQGILDGNIDIPAAAITGSYSLEVYTSNDILLSAKNFMIEEFVPDRIKVNTKLDKTSVKPGEAVTMKLEAFNFFGPPAADRKYESEIQVKRKNFSPAKFPDYDFDITIPSTSFDKIVREGKTSANGSAEESFTPPASYANSGMLEADFYTTVFDETGRPVTRSATIDIVTQDVFFGVKNDWFYYYPLNQAVHFPLAAVDKDGNAINAIAKVQVIKHEYRTVLARSGSYFRYESQQEDKLVAESNVNVNGSAISSFIPRSPGDYELRVYQKGANGYVGRSFYSYGSWGMSNTSFEVNNEGHVDIKPDKKSYYTGETAKVQFTTPFNGRLLVTTERDHVINYQYVNVENRAASIDLKLSGEEVPNIYITATLIKPHEVSEIPLTVAHGFLSIKVEDKSRKINVAITASKAVRSRTHQKVMVKATPGSYITLAAVDNGVLQVSDFKTPDPYNYFYQKKALQVDAYDLYPLLFPEVRAKLSSSGGDGDLDMNKRVNPVPAKRFKLVSYWSGIAKANGNGEASFEFDIPQFSGEVRLMAVACKDQSFGTAEQAITVADPIVISTALPRFLSPGDTVMVPVTLTNTTSRMANISATMKLSGPLRIQGPSTQSIPVAANSEGRAMFQVIANPQIAAGQVSVEVNALGEKFHDETEIAVRPPSTLQKITGSGSITGGNVQPIEMSTSDFIPGSQAYHLVVSRSPIIELTDQLRYLVQYPYGCTEQTVSAAFPQLYYGDMADLLKLNNRNNNAINANSNIIEAIRKIKMRQLYNGAVTLWDGEGEADWWATIYSAHFLLEAKKAGFDVDKSLLETMLGYVANRLKTRETINYFYNRNQNRKIAPKEVAYGLYVLSLAGRQNVSAMNYYKSNTNMLALDSKYLLASAYATAGDKKAYLSMLPASFSGEESVAQTGGSYYSDIRDEAISLNALIDVDPGNPQIAVMAKHVSMKLKSRNWLSTQERAFAFLALGKIARSANHSDVTGEIFVNGKSIAKISDKTWSGDASLLKSNRVEIRTAGNGRLYYSWESEGISASGQYKEEDNFIRARRSFYDRFGRPLSGNSFRQNDLVIVALTLENAYSTSVENIVLTDLLPAGFEIENPRTKEIPGMDWIKNASEPTALDVRDDRIHFFVDLNSRSQTYYYAMRAVSPGIYKMGPVSADAMYNGEYHSYHGAGIIRIVQ